MSRRRNPLLAEPPQSYHRLQQEHRITRHGWMDPHIGVHVTDDPRIAAGYAYSAWSLEGGHPVAKDRYTHPIPVVLTIDVQDLPVEPDVDALLWWYEQGGREIADEVLEDGADNYMDNEGYSRGSVGGYLLDYLPKQVDWEAADPEVLNEATADYHGAIRELLLAIFPQRRIMQDIDLSDVVEIRAFAPWSDRLLAQDEDEPTAGSFLGNDWLAPLDFVYEDEIDNWEPRWQTLWKSPRKLPRYPELMYHGTTSVALAKAFPELSLPASMMEVFPEHAPRANPDPRLTEDQKRIMLVLADAAERGQSVRLVTKGNIRETTTGAALVRKGLAKRLPDGRFKATDEGYWLGDGLRAEDRDGRIPPRRKS